MMSMMRLPWKTSHREEFSDQAKVSTTPQPSVPVFHKEIEGINEASCLVGRKR